MAEFYPWLILIIGYIPLKLIKISHNDQNKLLIVIVVSTAAVYGNHVAFSRRLLVNKILLIKISYYLSLFLTKSMDITGDGSIPDSTAR